MSPTILAENEYHTVRDLIRSPMEWHLFATGAYRVDDKRIDALVQDVNKARRKAFAAAVADPPEPGKFRARRISGKNTRHLRPADICMYVRWVPDRLDH